MSRRLSYHEVEGKVVEVDRLRKEKGWGVAKACKAVGIGPATYYRFKSQPDTFPREDRAGNSAGSPAEQLQQLKKQVEDVDARLREYGVAESPDHPLVQKVRELKDEIARTEKALGRVYSELGITGMTGPSGSSRQSLKPEPVDILAEIAGGLQSVDAMRERFKEIAAKLGFKLEDRYVRREEVDRLLEEEKRKWMEERLDDRRIQAVENIIRETIDKAFKMFQPAVEAIINNITGRMSMQMPEEASQPEQTP
jgi:hypothetical protein